MDLSIPWFSDCGNLDRSWLLNSPPAILVGAGGRDILRDNREGAREDRVPAQSICHGREESGGSSRGALQCVRGIRDRHRHSDTPRRFPLAQEIIKGTTKSAVLASFATPAATVSGADVGQLLERLIYLDASSKRTTSIYFVDGKVIRAETYTQ